MLPTRSIPIFDDDHPDDWHTFIYKASTGSIKAADTLDYANMAYMVAFTGDPESPNTMHLDEYNALVRQQFPATCPIASIRQFHDTALDHHWIPSAFNVSQTPINVPSEYVAIWGRPPVNKSALINDAMLNCIENWSANHYIDCVDGNSIGYDSRSVLAGMLYLSVTWPGT